MELVLAIDPSILSLGWAVFSVDCETKNANLEASGTVTRGQTKETHEKRINNIISGLEEVLKSVPIIFPKCDHVVIEKPQQWGAYKSVASTQSGALLGLHILVGALYWWGRTKFYNAVLIPVSEWKGQLPKRVTMSRMEAKYKRKFKTDDESDAVGIGDYFIGKELIV